MRYWNCINTTKGKRVRCTHVYTEHLETCLEAHGAIYVDKGITYCYMQILGITHQDLTVSVK